jgi:hypothetical protein
MWFESLRNSPGALAVDAHAGTRNAYSGFEDHAR